MDFLASLTCFAPLKALHKMVRYMTTDIVTVRTSQLEQRMIPRFHVRFDMLDDFLSLGNEPVPIDKLLDTVQRFFHDEIQDCDPLLPLVPAENEYQAWNEKLHQQNESFSCFASILYGYRPISSFDTMSHPCAMVLAVSSNNPDPLNAFARLYEQSKKSDVFAKQPFVESNILRCYLVVHDTAALGTDMSRSMGLFEEVRRTYGLDCAIVHVNSASEPVPEVHALYTNNAQKLPSRVCAKEGAPLAQRMSLQDAQRVQSYVRELITKSLVPFLERSVQHLGEHISSQRLGLTGRLLGASRKWLLPRGSTGSSTSRLNHDIYPANSIVSQTRRLGDLAIHVRDYRLASTMYDAAYRDYEEDQAAMYSACASEMLGLAQMLHASLSRKGPMPPPSAYLRACDEYVKLRTGEFYALRASVLYAALLNDMQKYDMVAMASFRAAQFTDEIVRALLLEQASMAYLRMERPHTRRSAASLLQAASQYEACGQKHLALRCYTCAVNYYKTRCTYLYDHALFKMAFLVHNSGRIDEALSYLLPLLHGSLPPIDELHLRAIESVAKYAHEHRVTLPSPFIVAERCCILRPSSSYNDNPCISLNEPCRIELFLVNPLGVRVSLTDVRLHFSRAQRDGTALSSPVEADAPVQDVILEPNERRSVVCSARIFTDGYARVSHATYTLSRVLHVHQSLQKLGPRLQTTVEQRRSRTYAHDKSLLIWVSKDMPCLELEVTTPARVTIGEIVSVSVRITNTSSIDIESASMSTSPCNMQAFSSPTESLPLILAPSTSEHALPKLTAGAHCDIPCLWHVTDSGSHTLTWHVKYATSTHGSFEKRASRQIQAQAMMNASFHIKLADQAQPAYMLALHVSNVGSKAVTCTGISFVSPLWTTVEGSMQPALLAPGDTFASLVRLQPSPSNYTLASTLRALHAFFDGSVSLPSPAPIPVHVSQHGETPAACLLHYASLYTASRSAWARQRQISEFDYLPPHIVRALPCMDPNDIDVTVHWRDENGNLGDTLLCGGRVGVQYASMDDMAILNLLLKSDTPQRAMYEETAREQAIMKGRLSKSILANNVLPLSIYVPLNAIHMETVPFVCPMTLHVRNEAPWPLHFTIEMVSSNTGIAWLGNIVHKGTVPAWSSIPLRACVFVPKPGIYEDLGAWRCSATLQDNHGRPVRVWTDACALKVPFKAFL
jgi:trafficking protein particle complex subunit 8